jgi:hypothetical protein
MAWNPAAATSCRSTFIDSAAQRRCDGAEFRLHGGAPSWLTASGRATTPSFTCSARPRIRLWTVRVVSHDKPREITRETPGTVATAFYRHHGRPRGRCRLAARPRHRAFGGRWCGPRRAKRPRQGQLHQQRLAIGTVHGRIRAPGRWTTVGCIAGVPSRSDVLTPACSRPREGNCFCD